VLPFAARKVSTGVDETSSFGDAVTATRVSDSELISCLSMKGANWGQEVWNEDLLKLNAP
jgi:hypothetical protein